MSREARSRLMAGIRGRDTRPELVVRRALFALGFRYRLHGAGLPGSPDLVFPRFRAVVFIHGCFWHRHGCSLFKWPANNAEFWKRKIDGNALRDEETRSRLTHAGWRVMTVGECAVRGRTRLPSETVARKLANWIESERREGTLAGSARETGRSRLGAGDNVP